MPITGFIVLCLILNLWWGLYRGFSQREEIEFLAFLPTVFILLTLFLLAAAVFPDEKLGKGGSMLDFYLDNRVQFWGLFAAYLLLVTVNMWVTAWLAGAEPEAIFVNGLGNLAWFAGCVALMITRRMVFHWIVVALSLGAIFYSWSSVALTQAAAG